MQTPFFLEGNTMEPNKDKKPEKRSVRFIEGKGFYIALVLCAAVIGVSAW